MNPAFQSTPPASACCALVACCVLPLSTGCHSPGSSAVSSDNAPGVLSEGQNAAARSIDLARGWARSGESSRAEQYVLLAVEQGYAPARALHLLLQICVTSSQYRAALLHAEPWLRAHPGDARLRTLVAVVRGALGQSELATAELARVISGAPEHALAHYFSGIFYLDLGRMQKSAEHFEHYLHLEPEGDYASEARAQLQMLRARASS